MCWVLRNTVEDKARELGDLVTLGDHEAVQQITEGHEHLGGGGERAAGMALPAATSFATELGPGPETSLSNLLCPVSAQTIPPG